MPTLYVITGPSGIGKTTVSKALAKSKQKSVLIEGDEIYHQVIGGFIPAWKEGNHLSIFWKICKDTIQTYLADGYDVVFNYIISPEEIEDFKNTFTDTTIKFIVLIADEETLLIRDKERPEDCQMKERCIVLLNNFKDNYENSKYLLDTSHLSVDEIKEQVEKDNQFIL